MYGWKERKRHEPADVPPSAARLTSFCGSQMHKLLHALLHMKDTWWKKNSSRKQILDRWGPRIHLPQISRFTVTLHQVSLTDRWLDKSIRSNWWRQLMRTLRNMVFFSHFNSEMFDQFLQLFRVQRKSIHFNKNQKNTRDGEVLFTKCVSVDPNVGWAVTHSNGNTGVVRFAFCLLPIQHPLSNLVWRRRTKSSWQGFFLKQRQKCQNFPQHSEAKAEQVEGFKLPFVLCWFSPRGVSVS